MGMSTERAVSPILAVILLVAIAMTAAVLVWLWLPNLAVGSKTSFGGLLKIEAVSASSEALILYIRNIGDEEVHVDKVSFDDPATGLSKAVVDLPVTVLKPGSLAVVNVPLPPSLPAGRYVLRVLSRGGVVASSLVIEVSLPIRRSTESTLAKFSIISYNATVTGPAGSEQMFVAVISNVGNCSGAAVLEVRDSYGNLVKSTSVSIPSGQNSTVALMLTLPSNRGSYTWIVRVNNTATGNVDDTKDMLIIAKDLYLLGRGAISFSSFDTWPNWTQNPANTWSTDKGILTGTDNTGAKQAGTIIYDSSARITETIYFLVRTELSQDGKVHWGAAVVKDKSNWVFGGIYTDGQNYYLEVYQVENNQASSAGRGDSFSASGWATLFMAYTPTGSGSWVSLEIYTSSGNYSFVSTLSASGLYPGLTVNDDDKQKRSRSFDDFVASASDPRVVTVTGLEQGWIVELYDSSGGIISSATAYSSGKAALSVLKKPVIAGGKIVIKNAPGKVIIEKTFSVIVGGDTYTYG
jgi:flagellin-like protein